MDALDPVVRSVVRGDVAAWQHLQLAVAPRIEAISRSHPAMRKRGLHTLADDLAEVTTATLERLAHDHFKNLARYLEQLDLSRAERAQSLDSWIYGAVDYTIREHIRQRYGRAPRAGAEPSLTPRPSKRQLQSEAGRFQDNGEDASLARTIGVTTQLTAREILAHVDAEFAVHEAKALRLYYADDRNFEEIARELQLPSARDAEKLIRKLNGRLRYRFGTSDSSS